jgi:hypothetical protein
MSSWRLLISWMKSSGVSRVTVLRSLLATTVAQLSANALSIGAPLLLCLAWTQQHWTNPLQRIAVPLVIIELLAFFRSPLRYLDRMHAHRLGFAAVTQWRTWLTRRVATWSFRSTANTSPPGCLAARCRSARGLGGELPDFAGNSYRSAGASECRRPGRDPLYWHPATRRAARLCNPYESTQSSCELRASSEPGPPKGIRRTL